jgi:acyl phosphate:glycerol-3-phosphate acyltransferase
VTDQAWWVLAGLLAYLLGAVPFSLILGRALKGVDLRQHGSGNLGATNALRVLGPRLGVTVLLLDAAKGTASVLGLPPLLAAAGVATPAWLPALLGGLAVVGHVFPIYLRLRGGKGVATSAGAFAALHPPALGCALAVFVLVVAIDRRVSLGSVLAALTLPTAAVLIDGPQRALSADGLPSSALFAAAALLVVARHRANLSRVWSGTEPRLGGGRPSEVEPRPAPPP